MQDVSVPYLMPVTAPAAGFTSAAGIDSSSWDEWQQMFPAIWAAPQASSYATHMLSEAPQVFAMQGDQEIKSSLIEAALKSAPSFEQPRPPTHSRRRATIKTRWGVKEVEVVSSQASTADTAEAMPEEAPELHATSRPKFESCEPGMNPESGDSSCMLDLAIGQPHILSLEQMLAHSSEHAAGSPYQKIAACDDSPPQLGSSSFPSVGSIGHHMKRCKPCAFVTRTGCANGMHCTFCHLCEVGEKKRRRKEKKALIVAKRKLSSSFPAEWMSLSQTPQ